MKVLKDQSFWLGSMATFAIVFFALFVGMVKGSISVGDNSGSRIADPRPVAPEGYGEPAAAPAPTNIEVEAVTKDDWVRGDRNAKVSVIEFSDIDCPFCTRFHDTMNNVIEKYDGQVNWVYRDFPLPALHPQARAKAIAAECVGELSDNDTYWKYLDGLFASSAADEVTSVATGLGIDASKFAECQKDPKIAAEVDDDMRQGSAAGASGTPYSVIVAGDEKIVINGAQPEAQITASIERALAL